MLFINAYALQPAIGSIGALVTVISFLQINISTWLECRLLKKRQHINSQSILFTRILIVPRRFLGIKIYNNCHLTQNLQVAGVRLALNLYITCTGIFLQNRNQR